MQIEIKKKFDDVQLPAYATVGSAGFDIVAHNFKRVYHAGNDNFLNEEQLRNIDEIRLNPGDRALIGTGFAVAIPPGYLMDIRARSGLALKEGISVLNSPGTIDSDYRDEIGVIIRNNGFDRVVIKKGERIAQGLILAFDVIVWRVVDDLPSTEREGGFGSTGKLATSTVQNY